MLEIILCAVVGNIIIGIAIENRLRSYMNISSKPNEKISFSFMSLMLILFWSLIVPAIFVVVLAGIIYRLVRKKMA